MRREESTSAVTRLMYIAGGILALAGLLVPTSVYLEALSPGSAEREAHLLSGVALFKGGLVVMGVFLAVCGRWWVRLSGSQSGKESGATSSIELAILAALLVAATLLRLFRLNDGLWFDEIVTYVNYAQRPILEIISTYDNQNQHFLFSILARLSFVLFGESGWALRLPAVAFGIGSVWALYAFGREAANRGEALLAAALMAFSYQHVWFSQNARGYTGLLFWTLVTSCWLLKALRTGHTRYWLLFGVGTALGMYTHLTMLFVTMAQFVVYVIHQFSSRSRFASGWSTGFALGFCLSAVLTFELYALVVPQIVATFSAQAGQLSGEEWKQPLWGVIEMARGMQLNFGAFGAVGAVLALLVFASGLLSLARTHPAVVHLFVWPVVFCTVVKLGMGHYLWPRSFFFAMGLGALVVVRGTTVWAQAAVRYLRADARYALPARTALCAVAILVSALALPRAYGAKQDFVGAQTFVVEETMPGDRVVMVGWAAFPYTRLFGTEWQEIDSLAGLDAVRSEASRTWLLYTLPILTVEKYPEIMKSLQQDFEVVREFRGTLSGGEIVVCRSRAPAGLSTS